MSAVAALVLPEDCAPHPNGVHGRCRHCGMQEGSNHDDGCESVGQNPLSDDMRPSPAPPGEDAPEVVEDAPDGLEAPTAPEATVPGTLTEAEVRVLVPTLKPSTQMVLLGERIYLRDGKAFRLLSSSVELVLAAQVKIAEWEFLSASVEYWREADRLAGTKLDPLKPDRRTEGLRALRDQVYAMWERYRELLDG